MKQTVAGMQSRHQRGAIGSACTVVSPAVLPAAELIDGRRLVFIDSLRGIAAVLVLLLHAGMSPLSHALLRALPHWYIQATSYGYVGVEIFFVISGFVIAYALRNTTLTPRSIGRFIVRRQVRLDPPYWVVAFLSLAVASCEQHLIHEPNFRIAGAGAMLLNLLYLHRIARVTEVVAVSWTLCIEIQFYLVFVGLMFVAQRNRAVGSPSKFAMFGMLVSGIGCLLLHPNEHQSAWFFTYWSYFVGGVLCYWALGHKCPPIFLGVFLVLMVVSTLLYTGTLPIYIAAITLATIYMVGMLRLLPTLFGGAVFQYLGRISYSLYLVHWPIRGVFGSVGRHLTGERPVAAAGWYILTILSSFLAAHLLYTFVERPSMLWASALKGRAHPSHRGSDPVIDS
jgi:peptidoglycan/LPS O-acetylase OafA/YrhL